MGVQFSVITCGRCGKSRGLRHECVTSAARKARRRRTTFRPRITVTCGQCGKTRTLRHMCVITSDFKERKAAAGRKAKAARTAARKRERRQAAAERKREAAARRRAAARERKAAARTRPRRPRIPPHDYRTCTDPECEKYGCLAYRQGIEDCPRPHEGT
jgi:hypothetical protein